MDAQRSQFWMGAFALGSATVTISAALFHTVNSLSSLRYPKSYFTHGGHPTVSIAGLISSESGIGKKRSPAWQTAATEKQKGLH